MILNFDYVNWRGEDHNYVVDFAAGHNPGITQGSGDRVTLSGQVLLRDDKVRTELIGTVHATAAPRRSFDIEKMRNVRIHRA